MWAIQKIPTSLFVHDEKHVRMMQCTNDGQCCFDEYMVCAILLWHWPTHTISNYCMECGVYKGWWRCCFYGKCVMVCQDKLHPVIDYYYRPQSTRVDSASEDFLKFSFHHESWRYSSIFNTVTALSKFILIVIWEFHSNWFLFSDTEDASETDMMKKEEEFTEIKEQWVICRPSLLFNPVWLTLHICNTIKKQWQIHYCPCTFTFLPCGCIQKAQCCKYAMHHICHLSRARKWMPMEIFPNSYCVGGSYCVEYVFLFCMNPFDVYFMSFWLSKLTTRWTGLGSWIDFHCVNPDWHQEIYKCLSWGQSGSSWLHFHWYVKSSIVIMIMTDPRTCIWICSSW